MGETLNWKKTGPDNYEAANGRLRVVRMPAWANHYTARDQWTLIIDGEAHDVYDTLREAKERGEAMIV